jgi:hypothetical protein
MAQFVSGLAPLNQGQVESFDMTRILSTLTAFTLWIVCQVLGASAEDAIRAAGPLRVLQSNPRYFSDGSGRAIYLAGSHHWSNFQDNGHRLVSTSDPPPVFDYEGYLALLAKHHHNFFRLWRWEIPTWYDAKPPGVKFAQPHPWERTGPGTAVDGKSKFDLTRFDEAYFERMRSRIRLAGERGIYVSIMLFEGWAIQMSETQKTNAWQAHPFRGPNNVNAMDADATGQGANYFKLLDTDMGRRTLALQEAYVRKVVNTVNDLDNVLYEIANEPGDFSLPWQNHMIRFIHDYETTKPKQHPVGMTYFYRGGTNQMLFDSAADWVSPNPGSPEEAYKTSPSAKYVGKVIVNDTDHLWGHQGGDSNWVWRSFTRGLNVLFMEELLPSPTWQDSARVAMGQTRDWSQKIDLAHMLPEPSVCQTGYALAKKGDEYLSYQDGSQGEFWLNLTDAPGEFAVEWFNITAGTLQPGPMVQGGQRVIFTTPFPGPAALHVKRAERN